MSILSANTLFHFTKRENLLGILENGFYPRYSLEQFALDKKPYKLAVPMVSFCDIPLSQIKNHVKDYGSYGIGMAKHWVEQHKLNPVLYLTINSTLSNNFRKMLSIFMKKEVCELRKLYDAHQSLKEIMQYFKPYEGILIRPEKRIKKRFYDEREWRYVPSPSKYASKRFMLTEKEFNDDKIRETYTLKLQSTKLGFKPSDIRYIIVDSQIDITDMLQHLKYKAEKFKYDEHTMQILTSRILTYEQIKEDF